MNHSSEHVTASELFRRMNGPHTEEEKAYIVSKNKEIHDRFFAPFIQPIIDRALDIIKSHSK